jgi:hypothetical protein
MNNYIIGISKETLKYSLSNYWSLQFPESYFHKDASFFIPKESIVKKDELLELLVNSKDFLAVLNKEIEDCVKYNNDRPWINDLIAKWTKTLITNIPDYDKKKSAVISAVKIARKTNDIKNAKKQLNTAKAIFKKAGIKIKIIK